MRTRQKARTNADKSIGFERERRREYEQVRIYINKYAASVERRSSRSVHRYVQGCNEYSLLHMRDFRIILESRFRFCYRN